MAYFHPRDFDKEQPILEGLTFSRRIKSYVGLRNSFNKLDKFFEDFEFVSLSQAIELIDWDEVDRIKL